MKKFFVCLLVLLLSACYSAGNLEKEVELAFSELKDQELNLRHSNSKDYYAFYLPSSVVNIESKDTYNVFALNDHKIVMNLDVATIINEKHYTSVTNAKEFIFDEEYLNYSDYNIFNDQYYRLNIYNYNDYYLLKLNMNDVVMMSCVKLQRVKDVLMNMLIIAYSVEIDEKAVIDKYSAKDVIDYTKEQVNLFEIIVPKDGRLEELINSKNEIDLEQVEPEDTETDEIVNGAGEEYEEVD